MNEHAHEVSTGGRDNKRRGERLVKVDKRYKRTDTHLWQYSNRTIGSSVPWPQKMGTFLA